MRIAPKPSRLTVRSPPSAKVGFEAIFDAVVESAPKITSDFPTKSAAPLATAVPRNCRRVTPSACSGFRDSPAIRELSLCKRPQTQERSPGALPFGAEIEGV